jgi:hypothetical protein
MDLLVAEHVRMARVEGRLVVLDLRQSRYYAAPEPLCGILEAVGQGEGSRYFGTPDVDRLLDMGFLRLGSSPPLKKRAVQALLSPRRGRPEGSTSGISLVAFVVALALQIDSILRLRHFSLDQILGSLGVLKATRSSKDSPSDADLASILASFDATHRLIGQKDRCLIKSIALYRLLVTRGIKADLVIGVRLAPFSAHCWIQKGDEILNDLYERVRLFVPIASV